jgi:hypothetical protein
MRHSRLPLFGFALLALTAAAAAAQATKPAPPAPATAVNNVTVTVNYTGKGVVDAGHAITVFLFPSPDLNAQSRPIGPPQVVQKNGATVTFTNVTTSPVYVVAAYSEAGGYVGVGGPPPAGTPIAHYRTAPKAPPAAVKPGPKTAVKMSFNESNRWK